MTVVELLTFMRTQRFAVEASRGPGSSVQAALVGIAVTDALEIIFDTLGTTRKAANLRGSPRAALVLGGWSSGDERTVQFEGIAEEMFGADLNRVKETYFAAWPDGVARATWPGITYFCIRPTWIRYSDFNRTPPQIIEFTFEPLPAAPANSR